MSTKYRIKYSRNEELNFFSHLEIVELIRKTVIRSSLPVEYTNGFSPSMKIAFCAPLPVGYSSNSEYMDISLTENIPEEELKQRLQSKILTGITVMECRKIPNAGFSLMSEINYVEYNIKLLRKLFKDIISNKIDFFNQHETFMIDKTGKLIDSKKYIDKISYDEENNMLKLSMKIINQSIIKPDIFLSVLFENKDPFEEFEFTRDKFLIERQKGVFYEP